MLHRFDRTLVPATPATHLALQQVAAEEVAHPGPPARRRCCCKLGWHRLLGGAGGGGSGGRWGSRCGAAVAISGFWHLPRCAGWSPAGRSSDPAPSPAAQRQSSGQWACHRTQQRDHRSRAQCGGLPARCGCNGCTARSTGQLGARCGPTRRSPAACRGPPGPPPPTWVGFVSPVSRLAATQTLMVAQPLLRTATMAQSVLATASRLGAQALKQVRVTPDARGLHRACRRQG